MSDKTKRHPTGHAQESLVNELIDNRDAAIGYAALLGGLAAAEELADEANALVADLRKRVAKSEADLTATQAKLKRPKPAKARVS